MQTFDLIIIGAGRASNLAVKAGKLGLKVAIIEKSKLGGTCPNRGCVPSKLLIGYAHVARGIQNSHNHFIQSQIQDIDVQKIFEETNTYIEQIDPRYESRFNENVTVIRGEAKFVGKKVLEVNQEQLTAKNIVIATGTRPIEAPHEKAWTSDDIFPFKHPVPKSITIVGSGFIACELANFFDAIGIHTTQLVRSQTLLSNEDEDISSIFKKEYTQHVNVQFNTTIENIHYENDQFTLTLNTGETHTTQALLYATGRLSNADLLNVSASDIQTDERGFIQRDKMFQTTQEGVYVVGDASGEHMLQHAAAYEVNHLSRILFEECQSPLQFKYMPHAVFTDPEIASVGITERAARKNNVEFVVSTTSWQASAKALSLRIKYPRTKFLIDPQNYQILGCHMIGPDSATMMHQVLAIMHIDNDIRHLKEMLYIHPALSEALLPAAVQAVQEVEKYNT